MRGNKTKVQLEEHRDNALKCIKEYIDKFISDEDEKIRSKADKFSFWLEDYIKFLNFEKKFDPKKGKRYKRGQIIKAHLGFNVGSEEGGLHYCVVLDQNNRLSSGVVTIVPLTSVKSTTDIDHLPYGNIYIGNELYQTLSAKIKTLQKQEEENKKNLQQELEELKKQDEDAFSKIVNRLFESINKSTKNSEKLEKVRQEINRMKKGSIVLTGQITTISKIRIYDPTNSSDALNDVKLSDEKLDMIDDAIIKKYTKSSKKC